MTVGGRLPRPLPPWFYADEMERLWFFPAGTEHLGRSLVDRDRERRRELPARLEWVWLPIVTT